MTGPDSDAWATTTPGADEPSWDWLSERSCDEVAMLVAEGADDDALLDAAARYTLENLILNATHEIGEWLRFDARRIFASHLEADRGEVMTLGPGLQGNGSVRVVVEFAPVPEPSVVGDTGCRTCSDTVTVRAATAAAAWRFTCLPGMTVVFDRLGPAVVTLGAGEPHRWATNWTAEARAALDGSDEELAAAVQRDVHRMLIRSEVDRICRAFHVDGRRRWYLEAVHDCAEGPGDRDARSGLEPIVVRVSHHR